MTYSQSPLDLHSTAQHSTAQHSKPNLRLVKSFLLAIPLFATSAFANTSIPTAQNEHAQPISLVTGSATRDHACEAFLCFAGGLHEPACQSTIRKVTRDLARGKSFPVCRQVANSDGSVGGQNGSPKIWTQSTKRRVYVYVQDTDGATRQVANIRKR